MKRYIGVLVVAGAAFGAGLFMSGTPVFVQGQAPAVSTAAVAGQKGGIDVMGPYDVVLNWPKPLSNLPGHEGWTWGAVQGVFAESPDRVFILQRGELPDLKRPNPVALNQVGPSLAFPTGQVPFRNASQGMNASPPGAGGPGADPDDPAQAWKGRMGIDAWKMFVKGLYDASVPALDAINKKDADALLSSGEALDVACENCHLHYWYPPNKAPASVPSQKGE